MKLSTLYSNEKGLNSEKNTDEKFGTNVFEIKAEKKQSSGC